MTLIASLALIIRRRSFSPISPTRLAAFEVRTRSMISPATAARTGMAANEEKADMTADDDGQLNVKVAASAHADGEQTEIPKMSKAEKKRVRRNQRKENEKDKKRTAKRERFIDPTAKDNEDEIAYLFENGLRRVKPYFYTYQTYVRGRWIGRTVLDVVSSEFRYDNHENYATRMRQGLINVNGSPADASYILRNHDTLSSRVHRHEIPVVATPLTIVHEDDDFLVVNKPSTIPVHPCGRFRYNTVTMILSKEMGYKNVRTIHRLDRATSGILILVKNFAKTQEMAARLKNHDLRKEYVCRVMGQFPTSSPFEEKDETEDSSSSSSSSPSASSSFVVDAPLLCVSPKIGLIRVDPRGKEAQTSFQRLSYNGTSSVVKCIPKTGRTHQIRVHLQYLGFPIMNDRFYNSPALWGPRNGAGGDYGGKTDEQLLEDAARIHTVVNYLDADVYSELVRKHYGGEESATTAVEEEGKDASDVDRPAKRNRLDDDDVVVVAGDGSDASRDFLALAEDRCPDGDNVESNAKETPNVGSSSNDVEEPRATSSDYDPTCKDCVQPTRDPNTQELVMFLHAMRYSGPDFDFATPMPDWASETWKEDDEWKLY